MSVNQRLGFEIVGRAGNIDGVFNRFTAGLSRISSGVSQQQRQMSMWDRQWQAMGTTIRYFFAGQVIFGALGAIRALRDFQTELANVDTFAKTASGLPLLSSQLQNLGTDLVDISDKTITPVANLTQVIDRLYASLDRNVSVGTAKSLTQIIAQTAKISQVQDPSVLAPHFIGGVTAFGLPQKTDKELIGSVQRIAADFFKVTRQSGIVTGEDYAAQAGLLFKSAGLAGLNPEQLSTAAVLSTKFGGTPANNLSNLSQLLTYLKHPKTKANKAAYAQAGVDLNTDSGWTILNKLIAHTRSLGHAPMSAAQLKGLPDDATATDAGLSTPASNFITSAFGRIQSQRTLAVLVQVWNQASKTMSSFNTSLTDAKKATDKFNHDQPLAELQNTVTNFRLSSIRGLQPVINPVARGLNGLLKSANRHPTALTGV